MKRPWPVCLEPRAVSSVSGVVEQSREYTDRLARRRPAAGPQDRRAGYERAPGGSFLVGAISQKVFGISISFLQHVLISLF